MKVIAQHYQHDDTQEIYGYGFICPGCKSRHIVTTNNNKHGGPCWGFNNNINNPTFTPSLLAKSGHYAYNGIAEQNKHCWCDYYKEHPEKENKFTCYICHSFITDGKIQFLSDCTHELAGQTVDLPEIVSLF